MTVALNRKKNIENYVVKSIYKELIIQKERKLQDATVLRKRLNQIHGKKWKKKISDSMKEI